jgi:hypothetical protein
LSQARGEAVYAFDLFILLGEDLNRDTIETALKQAEAHGRADERKIAALRDTETEPTR